MLYYSFRGEPQLYGNTVRFAVPTDVAQKLGADNHPLPVCGEVAGVPFRGVLRRAEDGGWLGLAPTEASDIATLADREVEINVALDDEPREATIPWELTEALGQNIGAEPAWGQLSEDDRASYSTYIDEESDPYKRWKRAVHAAGLVRHGKRLEMDEST